MKNNAKLLIFGEASQKLVAELPLNKHMGDSTLLEFLRNHQIPIASSCFGEGICEKCIIKLNNVNHFACNLTISEIMSMQGKTGKSPIISISYI